MKKLYVQFLLILMFVWGLTITAEAVSIDPSNSNIQYMGRWNNLGTSSPWVAWKGSTIKVKFNGTAITGEFDAGDSTEQYRIIIDGVPNSSVTNFSKNRSTYTLASGLPSGEHVVEVMKETFNDNNTTFYGFEITGSIMSPPAKPSMKIEFFGDSNMDGTSMYSEQDSGDHGSYYAFPATVSRMLNAEHNDQSVGGATVDGGTNSVMSFINSADYYTGNNWTPNFDPDVIVINAGANDVGAGETTIKNRFKDVIAELRSAYGNGPHIVLWNAYGWDPDEPAEYTHEVVSDVGGNLSACLYPWMWEQWHGSMIEHAGQSRILAEHILSLGLGFTQVQDAEIFDPFGRDFDVANGSFEGSGKSGFNAFGWRYYDDSGVNRVYDPADAYDGEYYLQLTSGVSVHQGTDATGDFLLGATSSTQDYYVTLMMRGAAGSQAQIIAEYQIQQAYNRYGTPDTQTVDITSTNWTEYTVHLTAPAGVWQTFITLKASSGTVDFDAISMSDVDIPSVCGDSTCNADEDSCNCASDCGAPTSTETSCDDGDDDDCDGNTDCDDSDCTADPVCYVPTCGDSTCDGGEDQCSCPSDCGTPPSTEFSCTDGDDNDCDGDTDCADSDCASDSACVVGDVTITNYSFETPTVSGTSYETNFSNVPGWNCDSSSSYHGVWNPGSFGGYTASPDGSNSLGMSDGDDVYQNTGHSIIEGATYTLTTAVVNDENGGSVGMRMRGTSVLVESLKSTSSSYTDASISFIASAGQAGQTLIVEFYNDGGYDSVDNVRLSYMVSDYCGDGTCDDGEDICNCAADCGAPPAEICDNGIDEDCDGDVDCYDSDCEYDANCYVPDCGDLVCESEYGEDSCNCSDDCGAPPAEVCDNGVSDDCDGDIDCDDSDCASDPACYVAECGTGICDAGEDQCNCPSDCGTPASTETTCDDGDDEDCDGNTDCDDSDCEFDPACYVAYCGSGICDDGEDKCNCATDCGTPPSAETSCTDGISDDCDGDIDCDDSDCASDPACLYCGNGGDCDINDLLNMAYYWLGSDASADLSGNGSVDYYDFNILAETWTP